MAIRSLGAYLDSKGVAPISVSIRERTSGSIAQAIMYGSEVHQSTGSLSVQVIQTAFKNRSLTASACLDEPEIGLSEGYTHTLGEYIAQQAAAIDGRKFLGVVVITHSRKLVSGMLAGKVNPTFVDMVAKTRGLAAWLNQSERKTVEDLLKLNDTAQKRFKKVSKFLKI